MAPAAKPSKQGTDDSETPSNNLWVGNLASDVTDSELMDLFAQYGALDSVTTYSSRSYGFVFFKRVEDSAAAKESLQGALLRGNPIKIEFARPVRIDLCASLGLFGCCFCMIIDVPLWLFGFGTRILGLFDSKPIVPIIISILIIILSSYTIQFSVPLNIQFV